MAQTPARKNPKTHRTEEPPPKTVLPAVRLGNERYTLNLNSTTSPSLMT